MAANGDKKLVVKKTSGAATFSGQMFEVKMCSFLFLRTLNMNEEFCITSNVLAAGKFDDIVMMTGGKSMFMQLKHREMSDSDRKEKTVTKNILLGNNSDFGIKKYYHSFKEIKENWGKGDLQHWGSFSDARFCIYTNIAMTKSIGKSVHDSDFDAILPEGGKCVRFCEDDFPLLKDEPDFKEFLDQFRFYSEQKGEEQLDELIRKQLKITLGKDSQFEKFLSAMKDWWKAPSYVEGLTKSADIWGEMVECAIDDVCDAKKKKLSGLGIKFDENVLKTCEENLRSLGRNVCVVGTVELSCLKFYQSLRKSIVIDAEELSSSKYNEVIALWGVSPRYDTLIVDGWTEEIADIRNSLQSGMTLIEIHDCNDLMDRNIQIYRDTFSFRQLCQKSRTSILELKVSFQGVPISLNCLIDSKFLDKEESDEFMTEIIYRSSVGRIIGKELTKQYAFYIPRKFLRAEHVSNKIFFDEEACFVVSGMSLDSLQQVIPPGKPVEYFDVTKHYKSECRHFVIEDEKGFQDATTVFKQVHWLKREETGFTLKQSKGGVSSIEQHVKDQTSCRDLWETMLLPEKVMILMSDAGMGKSTEIKNLAQEYKRLDHKCWVISVVLNDHSQYLSKENVSALELLLLAGEFSACHRSLLEHELQQGGNIVILIDGFDEISEHQRGKVLDMVRELRHYKLKQLWITSRPVLKNKLDKEFSCLPFALQTFTRDDQNSFCTKFWKNKCDGPHDLNVFITSMFDAAEINLNDKNQQLTEIPLQTRMLAEVFEREASNFSKSGKILGIKELNILELYNRFVSKKWDIYLDEKAQVNTSNAIQNEYFEKERKRIDLIHMACAVHSFLEIDELQKMESYRVIMDQVNSVLDEFTTIEKMGIIINMMNCRATYIHRTFVEFFAARWFAENIEKEREYLKDNLFEERFKAVRVFFDRILAHGFKLHAAVINKDKDAVLKLACSSDVNEKDKGGRTPLYLSVINYIGSQHMKKIAIKSLKKHTCDIMNILLEKGADLKIEDEVSSFRPLTLADKIEAWSAVDILLEWQAESSDMVFTGKRIKEKTEVNKLFINELMETVAIRGYIRIAMFLVQNKISANTLIRGYMCYCSGTCSGTMLDIAAGYGHINMMKFLLEVAKKDGIDAHTSLALSWAAHRGDVETIQVLVEGGVDVNTTHMHYRTPIMLASEKGHVEIVRLLADAGADANLRDKYGDCPIFVAVRKNEIDLVKLLVEKGADVNIRDNGGFRSPIFAAAMYGHVNVVKLLAEKGSDVNVCDNDGRSPIFVAAKLGHVGVVKLLLQEGASINRCDIHGRSPISVASQFGYVDIVKLLTEKDADINLCDKHGRSPIFAAAKLGYVDVVKLLLQEGASINRCDIHGRSPISVASQFGHIDIVKLLTEKDADINLCDKHGRSPIFAAAQFGHVGVVKLLLEKGISINKCDLHDRSPISVASQFGHVDIVKFLAEKDADINLCDKHGRSPIFAAAQSGKFDVVKLFVEKGIGINKCDIHGRSPIYVASQFGHVDIVKLLAEKDANINLCDKHGTSPIFAAAQSGKCDVVKLLMGKSTEKSTNINLCGEDGRNLMLVAARHGKCDVVKLLAESGDDINACNIHGVSPIFVAAQYNHVNVVKFLIENGADINFDDRRKSPLHVAAGNGHIDIVKLLAKGVADINAAEGGKSAIYMASYNGHEDVVKLLAQMGADINLCDEVDECPILGVMMLS